MVANSQEETVSVAGTDLTIVKGGSGNPLLVFHEEMGYTGWLQWHSALAEGHQIQIPLHPGFGVSPRVEWISGVRDQGNFYSRAIRELGLGPVDVIGFSLGGWIAAEMAASCSHDIRRMVLVGPAGIRPPEGDIMDMFGMSARSFLNASVNDPDNTPEFGDLYGGEATPEQFEAWEDARAQASRLAWEPYMYNPSLAHLLEGVSGLPTLLIWGRQDQVVPLSAGEVYNRSIQGSDLVVFDDCGHRPEIENSREFSDRVKNFLS
jgi:pimeloyl-ACP methyl ester carboxylesterase